MQTHSLSSSIGRDISSSVVVFLVAIPLCLGIALASGAPLMSGIIAGVVGGVVVGALSASTFSVSGPAAGLTAVVLSSIAALGSFEAFLCAVVIAGALQVILGSLKAGFIADFVPANVIKGLLASIGLILIIKQIPHFVGWDADVEGEMSFIQPDQSNTLSELFGAMNHIQLGALIIAVVSVLILVLWPKTPFAKYRFLPAPLFVVLSAIGLNELWRLYVPEFYLQPSHLVTIPVVAPSAFASSLAFPDLSALANWKVFTVGLTIAIVASLETLLNIEATDELDPQKRHTPPNRELIAQGVGNMLSGLIGGLPVTSVIVRSSVNINAGAQSKYSAILHGSLILASILFFPHLLNMIPLAALAAILIVTGLKLAHPSIFIQEYKKGLNQFLPFVATVVAILFTDLLIGMVIGLIVSLCFILRSNYLNPFNFIKEKYHVGELIRIHLAPQVSFLNKATMIETLSAIPQGAKVVIDASESDYIDADIIDLVSSFKDVQAPSRNISVSLVGFHAKSALNDAVHFSNTVTREVQQSLSPEKALELLRDGNERFLNNTPIHRDYLAQVRESAESQHPFAAIVGCIDSRTPSETIFDTGLGEIFNVRIAGNVATTEVVASLEFACKVAGAKCIVVLGHTMCGAIKAAVDNVSLGQLDSIVKHIKPAVLTTAKDKPHANHSDNDYVTEVAIRNVRITSEEILNSSPILRDMSMRGEISVVCAMYDVHTGRVSFDLDSYWQQNRTEVLLAT